MQVRHIIAGTAARTMAQCFIHPIDTVKTRLQARLQDKQPLPLVAAMLHGMLTTCGTLPTMRDPKPCLMCCR